MRTLAILLLLTVAAQAEDARSYCARETQTRAAYQGCLKMYAAGLRFLPPERMLQPVPPPPRQPQEMVCFQIGRFLDCSSEY